MVANRLDDLDLAFDDDDDDIDGNGTYNDFDLATVTTGFSSDRFWAH